MAVSKRIGLGVTLSVDVTGGTSFSLIGAVVDGISEGEAKADMVDTSILADIFKTKSKSQVDPGEVTLTIAYDPDEGSSTGFKLLLASVNAVAPNWKISYPSGTLGTGSITYKTFFAHHSGMGRETKKDGMIVCAITLTKTGDPGF